MAAVITLRRLGEFVGSCNDMVDRGRGGSLVCWLEQAAGLIRSTQGFGVGTFAVGLEAGGSSGSNKASQAALEPHGARAARVRDVVRARCSGQMREWLIAPR